MNSDNQLKKLGPKGDSLAVFNDVRRYGKITRIDATNPLKILVYYREFTTVIELDRFLNIVNTVDLRKQNILQARAVTLAYDNNIWVYDVSWMLVLKGASATMVHSWTRPPTSASSSTPCPNPPLSAIRAASSTCMIPPRAYGYIFDHYGTLKTHLDLRGWQDFDVIGKNILGRDDQRLYRYEPGTLNMLEEPVSPRLPGRNPHPHHPDRSLCPEKDRAGGLHQEVVPPRGVGCPRPLPPGDMPRPTARPAPASPHEAPPCPRSHPHEFNIFAAYA